MKSFTMKSHVNLKTLLATLVLLSLGTHAGAQSPSSDPAASGGANPRAVSMYNLGLSAFKQGSPESAIIFFKRACDIDPNLADAQYNLAVIYQTQKRYRDAAPRFEEVLRLKPNDPDAHFQLGVILIELGRPNEARTHLNAIAPNNVHFAEAQRRLQALDRGFAQPQQPAYQPPQPNGNGNVYSQQPANPPSQQGYSPSVPGYPSQSPVQPAFGNPSTITDVPATPDQPQISRTPDVAPTSPPPAATPSNPVPVLPNSSLRVIATGFNAPAGLAFDANGNLYVANFLTNSIERIAPDGTRSPFSTGVNLRGPIGLIGDESGNLYVANYNGGTVARINPAGVSTIIATGFKKPYYLTMDRDGNIYVSQQEDNSVVRITLPKPQPVAQTP